MNIGQRVKYFREKEKFTQARLAELADVDSNNISRIERGEAKPNLETLVKLCNALGVSPNELLLFEYNAAPEMLKSEIAVLLRDCSTEDLKKIIEYIRFVTK